MPTTCQRCGTRPATIHVTEVAAAGGHAEAHLCNACCQTAGWTPAVPPPPVAELVASGTMADAEADEPGGEPACPTCGLQFSDYQQANLFGCAHDYLRFAEPVEELIQRWHGALRHTGRRPGEAALDEGESHRAALHAELADAVAGERYEEAARLRDQLRLLDGGA
jgi:protein arginine kinase activator